VLVWHRATAGEHEGQPPAMYLACSCCCPASGAGATHTPTRCDIVEARVLHHGGGETCVMSPRRLILTPTACGTDTARRRPPVLWPTRARLLCTTWRPATTIDGTRRASTRPRPTRLRPGGMSLGELEPRQPYPVWRYPWWKPRAALARWPTTADLQTCQITYTNPEPAATPRTSSAHRRCCAPGRRLTLPCACPRWCFT